MFDFSQVSSGLGGLLGGLFGDSGKPYDAAMRQYQQYGQQATNEQQPYSQAGKQGLSDYQNWLNGQKDPSGFINNLMGQYQESPYAKYLQQQSLNTGQNAASASGLMGSTPMMQQLQQNSNNIASQDQNQWLQNVLGINTQYGEGQNNLRQGGQQAANSLSNLYNQQGQQMGEQTYNKEASRQNSNANMWGGLGSLLGGLFT